MRHECRITVSNDFRMKMMYYYCTPGEVLVENCFVNMAIGITEDVEHYLLNSCMCIQILFHCLNGNFSSFFFRKHEHACRYAAESDTLQAVFFCKFQTRTIARSQKVTIPELVEYAANTGGNVPANV